MDRKFTAYTAESTRELLAAKRAEQDEQAAVRAFDEAGEAIDAQAAAEDLEVAAAQASDPWEGYSDDEAEF